SVSLRSAQVRRISWVRGVKAGMLGGQELSRFTTAIRSEAIGQRPLWPVAKVSSATTSDYPATDRLRGWPLMRLSKLGNPAEGKSLLDFAFLELDVLPHDRIVLLQHVLFGEIARVLGRDVVVACASRADQFNLLNCGFSHQNGSTINGRRVWRKLARLSSGVKRANSLFQEPPKVT